MNPAQECMASVFPGPRPGAGTTLSMLGAGDVRATELQGTERGTWVACALTHLLGHDQVLRYKSL